MTVAPAFDSGFDAPTVRAREIPTSAARRHYFAPLLLALLAAFPRFHDLSRAGIRFDDEGAYVADAMLWHHCARLLIDSEALRAVIRADKKAFQSRMGAFGVDFDDRYEKPCQGYTFLAAAAMFLFGERPETVLIINALLGVGSVLLTFSLGAAMFGRLAGFCSAVLLALSPYHVLYCRSALVDATAIFFVLLGLRAWIKAHLEQRTFFRGYLSAGFAFGYATSCHYRMAFVPILILGIDLLTRTQPASVVAVAVPRCPRIHRAMPFALGAVIPIALIESIFLAAKLAASFTDSYLPCPTYLQSVLRYASILKDRVAPSGGAWLDLAALHDYAGYFVHSHGIVLSICAVIGVFLSLAAPGARKWPALFVLATLTILSMQPYHVARAFSVALPAMCLCAALAVTFFGDGIACLGAKRFSKLPISLHATTKMDEPSIAERTSDDRGIRSSGIVMLAIVLTSAFVAPSAAQTWRLLSKNSHVEDACRFIIHHGGVAVAVPPDARKYTAYLKPAGVRVRSLDEYQNASTPGELMRRLREEGVEWIVIDPQHWHYLVPGAPRSPHFEWMEVLRCHLAERFEPAAVFSHLSNARREFLSEAWGLEFLDEMQAADAGMILAYRLDASHAR